MIDKKSESERKAILEKVDSKLTVIKSSLTQKIDSEVKTVDQRISEEFGKLTKFVESQINDMGEHVNKIEINSDKNRVLVESMHKSLSGFKKKLVEFLREN